MDSKTLSVGDSETERQSSYELTDFLSPFRNVQYYQFTTEGDAFLYRQVRKMVGAAVAMGLGRINETDIQRVLHDGDGSIIPLLAPAHGLYLGSVNYEREDGTTRKE